MQQAVSLPALDDAAWMSAENGEVPFEIRTCAGNVLVVQAGGRVLYSYELADMSDENVAIPVTSDGPKATITLDQNSVTPFCSPGSALERAFTYSGAGINTIDIKLHADAGPFMLSSTLQMVTKALVLQHVQDISVSEW